MIRVLQVFGEPLSNGGQEAFIMNMYRNIDRENVQFDFYTPFFCDNANLKNEIEKLGGQVFVSNGKFDGQANKKDFVNKLESFLRKNKYEIIHINSGSIFNLAIGAKLAKKSGAKKVIVHSHATGVNNLKYKLIKFTSKNIFLKNTDVYLACSAEAAKWKFPKKIIKYNKYSIVKNGIELEKFIYNEEIRNLYRKKLNIKEDEFVVGNIGRMDVNKNHKFLIETFVQYLNYNKNSKLLIIGSGSLKKEILNLIDSFHIQDRVILLENRSDINMLLQAMDIFVFPSIFEGLGIVTIEAQAAGLITICSEGVPQEAKVTELFKSFNLKNSPKNWAKEIQKYEKYDRKNFYHIIKSKGYDALDAAMHLQKIYMERENDNGKNDC